MASSRARLSTAMGILVPVILAGTALLSTATPALAGPNEGDLFGAVNAARGSAGLPAYQYAGDLASVARAQAERMAASGELYHNPNLGGDVSGWSRVGENIAYAGDWRTAHQTLMNSAPHRAAILDSGYTQMGVGTAVDRDGTLWVSEVFRTPLGSSGSGEPSGSGGGTSTGAPDSTTTSAGADDSYVAPGSVVAEPAAPTPEELLRDRLRAARERVEARRQGRENSDPILGALDFGTVMDTVSS